MNTKIDHGREQAEAQLNHIRELMEWLEHANECNDDECNYMPEVTQQYGAVEHWEQHNPDRALEAIHETPLSVEVNYGWHEAGASQQGEMLKPERFRISLPTGGPATRIVGELNEYGEPETARLEYQDWFEPWTELHVIDVLGEDDGTLLAFAQQFYFAG